mgnify:CR=1 FL=1
MIEKKKLVPKRRFKELENAPLGNSGTALRSLINLLRNSFTFHKKVDTTLSLQGVKKVSTAKFV